MERNSSFIEKYVKVIAFKVFSDYNLKYFCVFIKKKKLIICYFKNSLIIKKKAMFSFES